MMNVANLIDLLQREDPDSEAYMLVMDTKDPECYPVLNVAVKHVRQRGNYYKLETGSANAVVINGDL